MEDACDFHFLSHYSSSSAAGGTRWTKFQYVHMAILECQEERIAGLCEKTNEGWKHQQTPLAILVHDHGDEHRKLRGRANANKNCKLSQGKVPCCPRKNRDRRQTVEDSKNRGSGGIILASLPALVSTTYHLACYMDACVLAHSHSLHFDKLQYDACGHENLTSIGYYFKPVVVIGDFSVGICTFRERRHLHKNITHCSLRLAY